MKFPIHLTGIFIALLGADCAVDYYVAPLLKANWEVSRSKTTCHLKQEIPHYGSADFVHSAGGTLQFYIQEQRHKPRVIKASLSAMPAPWIHHYSESRPYLVYLDQPVEISGYGRLAVYGDAAETMIDVLLQGKFPTFTYVRAAPDSDRVETRVGVSAVKFSAAYEDFIACRNQLLPYGLDDLQDRVLYFHKGSSSLDGNAIREVGKLANLLREMPDVRVAIGRVTAGVLKADSKWFRKRADSIINYLNTNGIARKRIAVQSDLRRDRGNDVIRLYVFGPDVLRWFFYRKGNIRLNTAEKRRLDLLAKYLLEYHPGKLLINSHTDSKGSRASNKAISRKRAEVIRQYLVGKGVAASKIRIRAYGESRPAASNRSRRGRAKNRRVVIDLVG